MITIIVYIRFTLIIFSHHQSSYSFIRLGALMPSSLPIRITPICKHSAAASYLKPPLRLIIYSDMRDVIAFAFQGAFTMISDNFGCCFSSSCKFTINVSPLASGLPPGQPPDYGVQSPCSWTI